MEEFDFLFHIFPDCLMYLERAEHSHGNIFPIVNRETIQRSQDKGKVLKAKMMRVTSDILKQSSLATRTNIQGDVRLRLNNCRSAFCVRKQ